MTESINSGLIGNSYRSYMIRFWQSSEQGAWRASAQCVQTGHTILFGDVASLLAFLQSETDVQFRPEETVVETKVDTNNNQRLTG